MINYNLFLDDFRYPEDAFNYTGNTLYLKEKWTIVRDYKQFVKFIERYGLPNMVSFDHDLADIHYNQQSADDTNYEAEDQEMTGYHCAKWMIEYCMDNNEELPQTILVHSMNVIGKENIEQLIKNYRRSCV